MKYPFTVYIYHIQISKPETITGRSFISTRKIVKRNNLETEIYGDFVAVSSYQNNKGRYQTIKIPLDSRQ